MRKFVLATLAAGAFLLAVPAVAGAGLLSTGAAQYCDEASQPFERWRDYAYYILVPGGSFESGTPAWSLSGGAKTVSGNEPYRVAGDNGVRSLAMPGGSVATSPLTCFAFGDWHMRFFLRNGGSSTATLKVEILVPNLVGVLSVLDGGYVRADGTWDPSPKVSALVSNVGGLTGLTQAVKFRLRASKGASFQVDDVYLDPFKSH